jgi:hypothetical protein
MPTQLQELKKNVWNHDAAKRSGSSVFLLAANLVLEASAEVKFKGKFVI